MRGIPNFTWNNAISERIRRASRKATVKVGIPSGVRYPNGTPVEVVANRVEFGGGKVLPRPFVRNTLQKRKREWSEFSAKQFAGVVEGRPEDASAKTAMQALGDKVKEDIVTAIDEFTDPPLNDRTVKRKRKRGRNRPEKPLVDTGLLRDSFKVEVEGE